MRKLKLQQTNHSFFYIYNTMRRHFLFVILLSLSLPHYAQKRATQKAKAKTTAVQKKASAAAQRQKKTAAKRGKATAATGKKATGGNASINGLKNQSAQIKRNIKEQEKRLRTNERDVKQRLQNLMVINTEIADKRKTIDTIRHDINRLDGNIGQLNGQLRQLQAELDDRKRKYVKSMHYMHHNSSIQNQLMFIFSAKNFSQMFRRLRFMREYASYQRAQGEMVKGKQAEITRKHTELTATKQHKSTLLNKGERERRNLEDKQSEQEKVVTTLKNQQKTIQTIIAQQRKKDEEINAQIDRLVAIEVEKARARAAAEARRKAEAEAARKKAAELARKKAEAEAAARENARRIAEAAERKAESDAKMHAKEVAEAKKQTAVVYNLDSEDRRVSGSFESNKGRLPMPITGGYRIVSHFGQYNVEGLSNVRLDNKGINILGRPGSQARCIFDGEVSAVFSLGGTTGVMVRHGSYISVYCNLSSVSVHRGQKVSARQVLGSVGHDNILQFQLRRETAKLNPEAWLGR